MKKKKELIICSYGLYFSQFTLESLSAVKTCDMVFSHALDDETYKRLKKFARRVKIIKNLKPDKTAQAVVSAFKEFDKICFLTYGNPMFLNATTDYLKRDAIKAGVNVSVLNAVSSFDSMISLIGLNKFSKHGIRILDIANNKTDVKFYTEMDTMVFMLGDLNIKGNEKYKNFFIKRIISSYPRFAKFFMIDAKAIAKNKDCIIQGTIGGFKKRINKANERTTLFLPAISG